MPSESFDLVIKVDGKWAFWQNPMMAVDPIYRRLIKTARSYGTRLEAARVLVSTLDTDTGIITNKVLLDWTPGVSIPQPRNKRRKR